MVQFDFYVAKCSRREFWTAPFSLNPCFLGVWAHILLVLADANLGLSKTKKPYLIVGTDLSPKTEKIISARIGSEPTTPKVGTHGTNYSTTYFWVTRQNLKLECGHMHILLAMFNVFTISNVFQG